MRSVLYLALLLPACLHASDAPTCAHPALVDTHANSGYWIVFQPDVDFVVLRGGLVRKYGLTDVEGSRIDTYQGWGISVPSLTADEVAELRCEPGVKLISFPGT
jgi:hypothetical protein